MCRLVAYVGHDVLLENVLVKPINSIVMQSLHARESNLPTNGDGFGLGWYAPAISPMPALFKSIHDQWMLMHNGEIFNFKAVKRHLRHLLDDDIYNWIQGETDSEHLFALFLQIGKGKDLSTISVVADVLQATFDQIIQLICEYSEPGPSYFNICLTDGTRLLASRYCTDKNLTPETMHYSLGSRFVVKEGHYHMIEKDNTRGCLLVTSEKLTNFNAEWHDVPINHLMMADSDLSIQLRPLSL